MTLGRDRSNIALLSWGIVMGAAVRVTDHGVLMDHVADGERHRTLVATTSRERAEYLYAEARREAEVVQS
jgi:hypothetical protein